MSDQPIKALLYARVSSAAQAEVDKTSLDSQLAACRKLADENGWHVVAEIRDVRSGATLDRAGLDEVRMRAKARDFDLVIANSQDRLSRMQTDFAILYGELSKYGIDIWTVQEGTFERSPVGQMIRNNLAFASELDRARRSEATTRGKRAKVRSGKILGIAPRAPYGYSFRYETKPNGKRTKIGYDINEPEAAVVREVFDLITTGHLPRTIARMLNERGVRTTYADMPNYSCSGEWMSYSVRRLVKNEAYKGGQHAFSGVRKEASEGNRWGPVVRDLTNAIWLDESVVPAIVSVEMWEKANDIVSSRLARSPDGPKTDDVWLRGGLAVCGNCGATMNLTRRKNGTPYLKCGRSGKERLTCPSPSPFIHSRVIEEECWKVIRAILLDPTMLASRFRSTEQKELDSESVSELQAQLADLERRRQRLIGSLEYLDGEDLGSAIRRRDELIRQAEALRTELAGIEGPSEQRESEFERIIRLLEWIELQPETIDAMTVEERRSVAINLGVKVRVYPKSAPERLKIDIGARTGDEGFFEGIDWSSVSSHPTASDLRFGVPILKEAARDGEVADDIRTLLMDPACRHNGRYLLMRCLVASFVSSSPTRSTVMPPCSRPMSPMP